MQLPKELTAIANYLSANPVAISRKFADGRINASANEDEIISVIGKNFDIHKPKARAWYDFSLTAGGILYPVNIKVADVMSGYADNLNCKLGIYYALTGQEPDFANEIRWSDYFRRLRENIGARKNRDYFFLVFNKNTEGDVFVNSLRGLSVLRPAGNNLPFQCMWNQNRHYQKRSFNDAVSFIMAPFGAGIRKRAQIYLDFKCHFAKYV